MKTFIVLLIAFAYFYIPITGQGLSNKYDISHIGSTFIEFRPDGTGNYDTATEYINEKGERRAFSCLFTYDYYNQDGLPFIKITSDPLPYYSSRYDYIMLLSGIEIRDDEARNLAIGFASDRNKKKIELFIRDWPRTFEGTSRKFYDCTSFLIERSKSYPVSNLCSIEDESPWVESAPGAGIGEGFTIQKSEDEYPYLLIMNGYISFRKPYLYSQNARIKKIKVTGTESGISKILTVQDTPNPQTVDISFLEKTDDVVVSIMDAYPGSKYEDTCISLCITYPYKVIPDIEKSKFGNLDMEK